MLDKITNIKKTKCKNEGIEKICVMLENPKTPKITSHLYITENNKIIGTCALGEIGYQLHITDLVMSRVINGMIKMGIPKRLVAYFDYDNLRYTISAWNDKTNLSKPEIAEKIRKEFGDIE